MRYRVVVEANGDRIQDLIRSIVPNAFLTQERGQSMMQVGAFSDRDNAESAVRMLNQNGLRAIIRNIR
ncbi:MAG: SPOR domain-containing protein [Leptolyngbyaceae cyanobacterium CRU_2_3]|nr:SPOR domain-containing protein [Leptolyngbyaceae cyanobacterium CRU_2_3]